MKAAFWPCEGGAGRDILRGRRRARKRNFRPLCRLGGGEGVNPFTKGASKLEKKSQTRRPDMFLPESDDELDDFLSASESQRSSDGEDDTDV